MYFCPRTDTSYWSASKFARRQNFVLYVGGDIFMVFKWGGNMVIWTICFRRSFVDLRHIQLSTHAWSCHSRVDIIYCAYAVVGSGVITEVGHPKSGQRWAFSSGRPDIRRETQVFHTHYILGPAFDAAVNFNSFLCRLDRGIQSAVEMFPLKGGGVLHIVVTAPLHSSICVLLMHLLFQKQMLLEK